MLSMTSFATAEALSDDIVILYTNDVHTYIDKTLSYDVIAGVKAELLKQYKNVLLVDAGDHAQGTAYGSMDKGESIIKLMNAAGYDLATLGNHEFDYGMEGCIKLREWAAFPYTSCNFYHEENNIRNENVLDSYVAYTFGDKTVAFVGITTPESFTKSTPAYFQDENGNYIYGIAGGTDGKALYQDVQDAIDEAKKAGATTVIALGHLGDDKSSEPWTSEETIANVCGLDAFIDGHSHSTVFAKEVADKDGHTTILTQTGEYFGLIGMMVIDAETGAISTELLTANAVENGYEIAAATVYNAEKKAWDVKPSEFYKGAAWPTVEAVTTLKKAWIDEVTTALGVVIGSANVSFENYVDGKRMVRSQETNTGDFAADALYYLFDNMGLDVDVAIMNGGGVRNKAGITGEISYLLCKEIHTFGNVACLQTITGQELLDALEWGARTAGTIEECGGFLHVSGITYKIDGEYPSTVQQDEKGVWLGGPTGGYRVHDVKVYNKETNAYEALDLTASYNLAGYNYTLRDLGDGFNMFASAVNVLDYVLEDYMVLANYVQGFENATVEATNSPLLAKYAGMLLDYSTVYGSGRIVFESSVK
ncbi:MAG: bifunctional metallophosphatase/5'-nucleotidase [Clostridia bacterium]|nr:bifunctional metallophosphatase/5'-nucleotidase [Clostridia bacterium]